MKNILVLIIFVISLFTGLFANSNNALLKVHATIVPKIVFMDYDYKKKLYENKVSILLISDSVNYSQALKLKKYIKQKYKKGINGFKIEINIILYEDLYNLSLKQTIYYLFPTSRKNINSALRYLDNSKKLTFAYNQEDLKYGVNISLNIGKKIKPILNMNSLKYKNISLRPSLINISDIYYTKN